MYALILGLIPGDSSKKTAKFNRTAIQNAIENASIRGGDTLYIPAGKYWIYADKVGLPVVDWSIAMASNVHLVMDRNTTLVVKCSSCLSKYELFKFRNVTHSSLTGGKIDGRKGDFSKVEIQYCCGHGVSVVGESSHVIIADVQFIDCFLDGIFINNATDVDVINCQFDGNLRSGLSSVGVSRLRVHGGRFENSGVEPDPDLNNPKSGINLESEEGMAISDCSFSQVIFRNNLGPGVYVHSGSNGGDIYDIGISDCLFQSNGKSTPRNYTINIQKASGDLYRFRIIGNSIYDSGSNGISAFSVRDIIIANNIVEASGEKGILLGLCEQFAISGNTVIRSADDGIQVFSSFENASISHIGTISGNVVVGNGNTGIEQRGHCVSICGNVVCNNSFHGLAVGGHNDSAVGNVVAGNGAGARPAASNIYSTSPLCSFVGNMVRETDIASSGRAAAASASSITFETGKYINTNNVYNGYRVIIVEGTATGAIGTITGFNGSTGVAAIGQGWNPPSPSPDSTSKYIIVPQSYRTDYGALVQECKDTMFTANDLAISGQTAHLYINNDVTAHIHANKTSNSGIIIFGTDSDKQPGSDHMGGLLIVTPTSLFSSGSVTVTFDRAFNSGDHLPFVVVSLTDLSGSWTQPAGCKVSALSHSAFTIDYNNNGNLSVGYSYGISYVVIDK